jgi:hypothetical protein
MTITAIALGLAMMAAQAPAEAQDVGLQWWFAPATEKVFPESQPVDCSEGRMYGAIGEYEAVQLCLRADADMAGMHVVVAPRAGYRALPKNYFDLFDVRYVPTPKDPKHKWWPDPLVPLGPGYRTFDLKGGETKEVWVRLHLADDPPEPGEYGMDVQVWDTEAPGDTGRAHHLLFSAPLHITVWGFHMPRVNHLRTGFGTWTAMMAPKFRVRRDSRQLRQLKTQVYYELLNHRVCANELPFDFFDQRAEGLMGNQKVNGYWLQPALVDYPWKLGTMWERIRRRGVTRKAYILPWDEPTTRGAYAQFRSRAATVREVAPGLKILGTFNGPPEWAPDKTPVDALKGVVNIWDFITPQFDNTQVAGEVRQRQAKGEEGWAYVCCSPRGGNWANYLINMSALQHRVLTWQIYRAGLTGLLYWGVNYWEMTPDPWTDAATVKWISDDIYGDGSLVYPGAKVGFFAPLSSIRLECIRDSLEDYEYLVLAERTLGKDGANEWVARVTTGWTKFTQSPDEFEAVRRDLGEALASVDDACGCR